MLNILLIGSSFCGWVNFQKKIFEEMGWNCDVVIRDDNLPKSFLGKTIEYFADRVFSVRERKRDNARKVVGEETLKWVLKNDGGVIIDGVGVNFNASELEKISKKAVVIKLMADSVAAFPKFKEILRYYDAIYTYEPKNMVDIHNCCSGPVYLSYASYYDSVYYRTDGVKKYDVSFVGTMCWTDSHRRYVMEKLVSDNQGLRFAIYGPYAARHDVMRNIKWLIFDRGKYFKNISIPPSEANKIYNESKVNIYLNSCQTFDAWSSRLVELLGSGAFVLAQYTPLSAKYFEGGIVTFDSYEDLNDKLRYYLGHPDEREKIAAKGHQIAVNNFTATAKLKSVLATAMKIRKEKFPDAD